MPAALYTAHILLGSNINPAENLKQAVQQLRTAGKISAISSVWETGAVGSDGPNFLNAAAVFQSPCTRTVLKDQVLRLIEAQLGRVRSADKNAPRPIDLDIIVFDGSVVDPELWLQLHIALPMAELRPGLTNPLDGKTLRVVASQLHRRGCATPHPEIRL